MADTRSRILVAARSEFAAEGFAAARLQDIAAGAGIRHPTLLYHFGSKEGLYAAVIEEAARDWAAATAEVVTTGLRGVEQVVAVVEAGFAFFAGHRDLVAIVRREALDGGERLEPVIGAYMRPLLDAAVRFLRREVEAGQLREHDPVELVQLCYGAVLTPFSDAPLRARVLGDGAALDGYRETLIETLRALLTPSLSRPERKGSGSIVARA
jgi:TetR/AcrR family transcriptional regulator